MTTAKTPAKRGRPAKPRPNALAPTDMPVEAPVKPSEPVLELGLPDLKIIVEAMLAMPSSPENVDVYYKIETYRQELKEYTKNERN